MFLFIFTNTVSSSSTGPEAGAAGERESPTRGTGKAGAGASEGGAGPASAAGGLSTQAGGGAPEGGGGEGASAGAPAPREGAQGETALQHVEEEQRENNETSRHTGPG